MAQSSFSIVAPKLQHQYWGYLQHAECCCCMVCGNPQGLEDMTRTRDGLQRVPLMQGIGAAVFINDLTEAEMAAAANRLVQYAAANGSAAAAAVVAERKPEGYLANNVVRVPSGLLTGAAKAAAAAAEREQVQLN